jgi:hypothetical protein
VAPFRFIVILNDELRGQDEVNRFTAVVRSTKRLPCRSPLSPNCEHGVQLDCQRPTGVQNLPFFGMFSATQPRKGNRVIETYGAGDGNRNCIPYF